MVNFFGKWAEFFFQCVLLFSRFGNDSLGDDPFDVFLVDNDVLKPLTNTADFHGDIFKFWA